MKAKFIFLFLLMYQFVNAQDCVTWIEDCYNGGFRWVMTLEPDATMNLGTFTPMSAWTITQTDINEWTFIAIDPDPSDFSVFATGTWSVSGASCTTVNINGTIICSPTLCADCDAPLCTQLASTPTNYNCNDQGTSDISDDTFTFDISIDLAAGTGTTWTANDPLNSSGSYSSTTTLGPYNISDGDFTINITDASDSACASIINVIAPTPCSSTSTCTGANSGTWN